jgi:hypothetical protein
MPHPDCSTWPGSDPSCPAPVSAPAICALTQQPHGRTGEYSIDALCPPRGSSNTDYLDHLVYVTPALHVCRVYLSIADKGKEEVVVVLLNAGYSTIRHVRATLATEFKNRSFPVLRTTATSPITSWRSELLVFRSETGEKLRDEDTLPVASERAMRNYGRHSAVIAQLAIPTAHENRMQDFAPKWDDAQRESFAAKVCLSLFGLTNFVRPGYFPLQS